METVANHLEFKEFVISQGTRTPRSLHEVCCSHTSCRVVLVCFSSPETASQLQGHVHWIIEHSIKVVDAVASGHSAIVRLCSALLSSLSSFITHQPSLPPSFSPHLPLFQVPDTGSLGLLRRSLVLIYVWNKALPRAIIPVTGQPVVTMLPPTILAHFTHHALLPPQMGPCPSSSRCSPGTSSLPPHHCQKISSQVREPPSFEHNHLILFCHCCVHLTEISNNVPSDKHPNLLTLTKAAHIQGEWKYA